MLIKLRGTEMGDELWINSAFIVRMLKVEDEAGFFTKIDLSGEEGCVSVNETPEQIEQLLRTRQPTIYLPYVKKSEAKPAAKATKPGKFSGSGFDRGPKD